MTVLGYVLLTLMTASTAALSVALWYEHTRYVGTLGEWRNLYREYGNATQELARLREELARREGEAAGREVDAIQRRMERQLRTGGGFTVKFTGGRQ